MLNTMKVKLTGAFYQKILLEKRGTLPKKGKYRKQECYDADWTDEKVEIKLSQIVDVITKERKGTPDF